MSGFEYRIWTTSRARDGLDEAQVYTYLDLAHAIDVWKEMRLFRWLPAGHTRGTLSAVQVWRSVGGRPWFLYGNADSTGTVHDKDSWPKAAA